MDNLCKAIPLPAISRNSAQFREDLVAFLVAIIAQFLAMAWSHGGSNHLRAIPRHWSTENIES